MDAFKLLESKVSDLCNSRNSTDTVGVSEEDKGPTKHTHTADSGAIACDAHMLLLIPCIWYRSTDLRRIGNQI